MDNSDPGQFAGGGQSPQDRIDGLEAQVESLTQRLNIVTSQLAKLAKVVRQLMDETGDSQPPAGLEPQAGSSFTDAAATEEAQAAVEIPSELLQAIRLLTEGRSEEAQAIVKALPRETLADFPGIVAMVAAAVRIRKGEYDVARAALEKSRSLIEDPRLVKVIRFLEKQLG